MNSKQRSYLKGLAMNLDPVFQIGKGRISPALTEAIGENLDKHELTKITVLNNCDDDPKKLASVIAERTGSEVVQVIGKKIVLYKRAKKDSRIDILKIK